MSDHLQLRAQAGVLVESLRLAGFGPPEAIMVLGLAMAGVWEATAPAADDDQLPDGLRLLGEAVLAEVAVLRLVREQEGLAS